MRLRAFQQRGKVFAEGFEGVEARPDGGAREAVDLLMALNTGHTGALSTLHANSANAALLRLGTLASMGGVDLPRSAIEDSIGSAVDAIVQVERRPEGRVVVEVAAVRAGPPLSVEQIWPRA